MQILEGEEIETEWEAVFKAIVTTNFPKLMFHTKNKDPGSSEATKQNKCPQNYPQVYYTQTAQNQKIKGENTERSQRKKKNHLTYR